MVFVAYIPVDTSGRKGAQIWGFVAKMPLDERDSIRVRGIETHEFEIVKDYFKEELGFDGSVYHSGIPKPGYEKEYSGKGRASFKWTPDLDIKGVE